MAAGVRQIACPLVTLFISFLPLWIDGILCPSLSSTQWQRKALKKGPRSPALISNFSYSRLRCLRSIQPTRFLISSSNGRVPHPRSTRWVSTIAVEGRRASQQHVLRQAPTLRK